VFRGKSITTLFSIHKKFDSLDCFQLLLLYKTKAKAYACIISKLAALSHTHITHKDT